nr:uncharacterized protein LOC110799993 [Spinacia oleracea]
MNGGDGEESCRLIQDKNGQVYDCVDFYKQPTFTHPLFKNMSEVKRPSEYAVQGGKYRDIAFNGNGCPSGTIPLLRVNKNYSSEELKSNGPNICTAVVRTRTDPNIKFFGGEGSPSTYKPVADGPGQWSSARIKLQNGPDSIEVGWMVNPTLFNDKEAHLYVRFTAGQSGCINTQCPGFVHVGSEVPLGLIPDHYSQRGGQSYAWKFFIDQQDDGNWWVSMDDDKYAIGYWPKTFFTGLANAATEVEWGGEVSFALEEKVLPEMGNGRFPLYDTKSSAFMQHVTVVDETLHNVNPTNTEKFKSCQALYGVIDAGYQGDYFGHLILFGGPLLP